MSPLLVLYLGQTATTTTPSLTLNSPSNAGSSSSLTPTLEFTGVTNNSQNIPYEIQIDTVNTFNSVPGGSNPAVVQRTSAEDNNGGTGKVTVAFGSNNTAGNAIVIAAAVGWTTTSQLGQPQDTQGNVYTQILDVADGSHFTSQRWWIAYNVAGGANTVTLTDGFFSTNIHVYELSGVGNVNSPDQTAHQFQLSTTSLSTTATSATNFANELCLAVFCDDITSETFTLGTGYSNLVNQPNASFSSASEEKVISSTGAQTATMTIGSASTTSLGAIMTFANYGTPLIDASSPGPSLAGNNGSGSTATAGTTVVFTTTRSIRTGEQVEVATATRNNTNGAVVSVAVGSLSLSKDHGSSAGIVAYELWSAPAVADIPSGSTVTVTFTTSGSQDRLAYCFSLANVAPSSYVRGTPADAHAGSTSATVTSDANPLAGDMAIVILTEDVSNAVVSPTSSYALAGQVTAGANGTALAVAYKPLTASGASTASFTLSTSNNWAEMIVVYKAAPTAFADITNSGDLSPYPSTDQVGYTVGSALTNATVYYWRARQIAPPGNPNYLAGWSSTFSFTASTGGSIITKTQTSVARIAVSATKTQSALARIQKSFTKTQTAIARIQVSKTVTQTAVARVQATVTKTQAATARIQNSETKTQTAISRIAKVFTKTQSAVSRIQIAGSKTQSAVGRIQNIITKTQTATARITNTETKTQTAVARVQKAFTKTQSAIARVAKSFSSTQSATARISKVVTTTQGAVARIQKAGSVTQSAIASITAATVSTKTQTATARISKGVNTTQPATARIQHAETKTQSATARVAHAETKTQSAIARVQKGLTATQSATARISKGITKTQTGTSRIQKSLTTTQAAIARIAKAFTKTQSSIARMASIITKTQGATSRISNTVTKRQTAVASIAGSGTIVSKTQSAKARISTVVTKTQSAIASVRKTVTKTQTAIGRVAKSFTKTQSATSRIAITNTKTQPAAARIRTILTTTQHATAFIVPPALEVGGGDTAATWIPDMDGSTSYAAGGGDNSTVWVPDSDGSASYPPGSGDTPTTWTTGQ